MVTMVTHRIMFATSSPRLSGTTPASPLPCRHRNGGRGYSSVLSGSFWAPQRGCTLGDAKVFKAGLTVGGNEEVSGDITFRIELVEHAQ